jgi:hypothetical protein
MNSRELRQSLPSWVEADPLRGRAVDALGLQATADRIADEILPDLSVLTNRARYFAMLAWARKACGKRADEERIHSLEVALAVREWLLHGKTADDDSDRCRYVGSRNLAGLELASPPKDPRDAYRIPVWRAYRASMRGLGLLDRDDALTDEGNALAGRFVAACRPRDSSGRTLLPEGACLSALRFREATLLESVLGLRKKGKLAADDVSRPARRAALERELRQRRLFNDGLAVSTVLAAYESNRARTPSRTVTALREAAVWERLSVGLHAIFLIWLHNIERPTNAKRLIKAARSTRKRGWSRYEDIDVNSEGAATSAIQSIRRALALRDRLAENAFRHSDPVAFDLGEAVAGASTSIDDVFAQLTARHAQAKGDDAWMRDGRNGKELARDPDDKWQLPPRATLHGYRLGAFGSLLVDLQHARWVEPGSVTQHTNTATHGEAGEDAEAQSHTSGSKVSTENSVARKETQAKEFQTKFESELSHNVTRAFKLLEQALDDETKEHIHRHEEKVDWKVGVGPAKADGKTNDASKPAPEPAKDSGGGGLLSKAWNAVTRGAGWVYRKAKGVAKRIPIVRAAISLAGDIWDTLSGRASVERTSSETDGDTDSTKQHNQSSTAAEISSLDVIASKLTNEVVTSHRQELETMIATKFGTEMTVGDKQDTTKKKTVNDTYTTSSTVYEARQPRLVIKKLA